MDGVVEDVVDENQPLPFEHEHLHQPPPVEQPKSILFYILSIPGLVQGFLESYGWYILIGSIILYYLWNKYKDRLTRAIEQNRHRDIDEEVERQRLAKLEEVRQRQQAAMDAAAARYLEEKKKKEEQLAKQREEEWQRHQQGLGYRNKTKAQNEEADLAALGLTKRTSGAPKPKLRGDDYNPLTGQGSSGSGGACYRPSQRGRGGQGG